MIAIWSRAKLLRNDALALFFAFRDGRTPLYAKAYIALIFAYVLSPIDAMPEFIPGVGLIDDLVVFPVGVSFAQRLIPPYVLVMARTRAERAFRRGADIARWGVLILTGLGLVWFTLTVWQLIRASTV